VGLRERTRFDEGNVGVKPQGIGSIAAVAVVALAALVAPVRAQSIDTPLRVGVLPIVDVAPLYLGMQKGFFHDEHLAITPVTAQGGGDVAAAVISGDEQFGYGNVASMMLAAAHGLPMQAVTVGSQSIADGKHVNTLLMVKSDGPIKTLRDFEGKTLAVNALNTISEIMIKDDLERHGVDVTKVKFVEIPFPAMAPALQSGRVDIALEVEPFLTAQKSGDARPMLEPMDEYAKRITLATYFTATQYAVDHPDVVARFRRAMLRSLDYATANTAEVRAIIPTYTKIDADTAGKMALVAWGTQIDMTSLVQLKRSMTKQGLLTGDLDLKPLFPPAATAPGR
jgi:NitT/TauT family transport system substrate-binding protein